MCNIPVKNSQKMKYKKKLPVAKNNNNKININEDNYYFYLKDSVHEFTISLQEILKCVKFAEEEGVIPELSKDWWNKISTLYSDFCTINEAPEDDELYSDYKHIDEIL